VLHKYKEKFGNIKVLFYLYDMKTLEVGDTVTVKRKPTNENSATIVYRTIKKIDFKKKTIDCDDNIRYKFSNIIMEKDEHRKI